MLALFLTPQLVKPLQELLSGPAPRVLHLFPALPLIDDLLRPWHRLLTGRTWRGN